MTEPLPPALPLDAYLRMPPASLAMKIARLGMGLLLVALLWASLSKVEEVATATGEVIPQEQIQSVQHLEGGIVEEIFVREGTRIVKGEPLLQLNMSNFTANKEEILVELESLRLKRVRLMAEAERENTLQWPEELKNTRIRLRETEKRAFDINHAKRESILASLRELIQQKELDVTQLQAERNSIARNVSVLESKLNISHNLLKDKLIPRIEHLQLESEAEEQRGRLQVLNISIPKSKAALAEAQEKLKMQELDFQTQAQEELSQVELDIARKTEMLGRATDQVQRTTIKSPITGIIKSLHSKTLGGVIKPGEVIMEIVPESDNLVIESKLNPNDIGFVKVGQDALVKMNTYDFTRYGGLRGKVIDVSAGSYVDEATGQTYFKVVIRTDKNHLGLEKTQLPITPGMQAVVDIKTGHKSILSYLLKPVLKITNEALRER